MFDFDVERGGERMDRRGGWQHCGCAPHDGENNILLTRRTSEVGGGLSRSADCPQKKQGQTSIKSCDPRMAVEKYGGYNKLTGAYFILVEHTKKKNRVRSLETVFLLHQGLYEQDAQRYCRKF